MSKIISCAHLGLFCNLHRSIHFSTTITTNQAYACFLEMKRGWDAIRLTSAPAASWQRLR
jgi:hypothetical protein